MRNKPSGKPRLAMFNREHIDRLEAILKGTPEGRAIIAAAEVNEKMKQAVRLLLEHKWK